MTQYASTNYAEAERKLQEIAIQEARLREQKELWTAKLEEAKAHLSGGARPVQRAPITPPQMVPAGATIVEAEKITAAEIVATQGMPLRPKAPAEMVGAAAPGGEAPFMDAEPLMAKAKNSAGQQVLDRHGKRR